MKEKAKDRIELENKIMRPTQEKIEGSPKEYIESELILSTERYPELKKIRIDELYNSDLHLRVKNISDERIVFEVLNFRLNTDIHFKKIEKEKEKNEEEIKRDSEGSYKIRE